MPETEPLERSGTQKNATDATLEAAEMRGNLAGAEQLIQHLKAQLKDVQAERDDWREYAKEVSKTNRSLVEDRSKQKKL